MDRPLAPILVACLTASACASVEAAAKKVQVPDRFDGSWTITAVTKGSNKAPISGSLYPDGSGSGAWHTSGGLLTCRGSWSAKRTGQE